MCRNIALKHGGDVDCVRHEHGRVRWAGRYQGASRSNSGRDFSASGRRVSVAAWAINKSSRCVLGAEGLASGPRRPAVIVDLSTTTVAGARSVAERLSSKGVAFADAPVARTREAAQRGELSIMVGADEELFARIARLLSYMGSDVTHCGAVGCGQVVKAGQQRAVVREHSCDR